MDGCCSSLTRLRRAFRSLGLPSRRPSRFSFTLHETRTHSCFELVARFRDAGFYPRAYSASQMQCAQMKLLRLRKAPLSATDSFSLSYHKLIQHAPHFLFHTETGLKASIRGTKCAFPFSLEFNFKFALSRKAAFGAGSYVLSSNTTRLVLYVESGSLVKSARFRDSFVFASR